MTEKKILLILFATFIAAASAFAKRLPPPELEPITVNGLEYNVDYHISPFSERASITITDNTNPEITSVRFVKLYSKIVIPFSETDVQWVFVKKMELTDNDTILLSREDNRIYEFNLKDESVKTQTSSKPMQIITVYLVMILIMLILSYAISKLIQNEIEKRKNKAINEIKNQQQNAEINE